MKCFVCRRKVTAEGESHVQSLIGVMKEEREGISVSSTVEFGEVELGGVYKMPLVIR